MQRFLALTALLAVPFALAHGSEDHTVGKINTRDAHALLWLPDGRILFGHHDGVQVSTDRGTTFKALADKPNFDAMNLQRAGKTLVLAGHDVYATSTDGKSWKNQTFKGLGGTDLHGYAVNPAKPKLHYAWEARTGLHVSHDSGKNWNALQPENLPPDVVKLAASKDALYAVSARSGLWRSEDGAQRFNPVKTPEQAVYTVEVAEDGSLWLGGAGGVWRQQQGAWSRVADEPAYLLTVNPKKPSEAVWIDPKGNVLRTDN